MTLQGQVPRRPRPFQEGCIPSGVWCLLLTGFPPHTGNGQHLPPPHVGATGSRGHIQPSRPRALGRLQTGAQTLTGQPEPRTGLPVGSRGPWEKLGWSLRHLTLSTRCYTRTRAGGLRDVPGQVHPGVFSIQNRGSGPWPPVLSPGPSGLCISSLQEVTSLRSLYHRITGDLG